MKIELLPIDLADLKPHFISVKPNDKLEAHSLLLPIGYHVSSFFVHVLKYNITNSTINKIVEEENDITTIASKLTVNQIEQGKEWNNWQTRIIVGNTRDKHEGFWLGNNTLSINVGNQEKIIVQLKHITDADFRFNKADVANFHFNIFRQ